MSDIILDSGIFLARAFTEQFTKQAIAVFAQIEREASGIHAPTLLHYEVVSVIRMAVYSGRISPAQGLAIRQDVLEAPIGLHFDRSLVERAYDLAQELKLPRTYDAQYLALAERLGCVFWTADQRLFNSARDAFPSIHWLGTYEE